MEAWSYGAALWLLLAAFLAWRVRSCAKRRRCVGQEITGLVYVVTFAVVALLSLLFPDPPRQASIAVAVLWVAVSGALSYRLNRRFNTWVEREQKREEEQRRGA